MEEDQDWGAVNISEGGSGQGVVNRRTRGQNRVRKNRREEGRGRGVINRGGGGGSVSKT